MTRTLFPTICGTDSYRLPARRERFRLAGEQSSRNLTLRKDAPNQSKRHSAPRSTND